MDSLQSQVKLFRALLYCYPAEFRHEYGAEMEHLFVDRVQAEPSLRLWLETFADIALSAPREHWQILASDVKYGTRVLAAVPGFAAIALLVIALGIGSTTAIFSLVNAVLLRSLPYGHPEKLVYLWSPNSNFKGAPDEMGPNVPDFYDWQRLSHSFSAITMLRQTAMSIVRDGSNTRVEAAHVTASFFRTLEVEPAMGRSFGETDNSQVALISNALWQSQFHSASSIIGRQIQLNRGRYTVIGIMPKDFGYPFNGDIPYVMSELRQVDIWLPLVYTPSEKMDRVNFASVDAAIGRLRDGVSAMNAQAELKAIESRLNPLYPESWRGWTVLVRSLTHTIIGPVQEMLWLLLGAVGVVLLIAISNVANLLLARTSARAHELGIRTALGAERIRIIRQLLTESLLLSCVGGALGVVLAYAAVHLLATLNPGNIPRFDKATVDGRVLLVALTLTLVTGLLSGLAPAISASRFSINELLRQGGNRVGGTSHRARVALIVLEVALSVVLLSGAGLLIRSYFRLAAVDPGFSPSALTFRVNLDGRYNTPELRAGFYRNFLEKLKTIPGVKYAGASTSLPLSNQESITYVEIGGFGKSKDMVEIREITPEYRRALGTALLRGRDFTEHDVNSNIVLVNKSFVQTYLRGRDPLDAQVRVGIEDVSATARPWARVIGVVGDIRHIKLEEASQPQIFQPADNGSNFALQGYVPTSQIINQARAALQSLDPGLTLESVHTMGERISDSNARRTFQTSLLTGFAAVAVALALAGLYGLMSYSVKQRSSEIAVRLAVGSSRSSVLRLILIQGLRLTVCGLILGLAGSFALTRLVSSWLFGVNAIDTATFVTVPLFVLTVACCACLIPAWSATRIDPAQALRQ